MGLIISPFINALPAEAEINNSFEINVFSPEAVNDLADIQQLEENLGVQFNSYKWYLDWDDPLERVIPDHFHDFGKLPELAWQPQINDQGVVFSEVLNNKYDSYIISFAQSVKALGYPIRINLAPEMNADWETWGVGNCGNDPVNQKAFWQYVVTKFRSLGVNNVEWVWTPNVHFEGEEFQYSDLFPGDDYVDYLGLDGYNWGGSQSWSSWQTFREIFESSYNDLTALSGKRILIMETASTELGGDKAAWIKEMFASFQGLPQIKGFTWFNINKETDWRIDSSESAKRAFSESVQGKSVQGEFSDTNNSDNQPPADQNQSPEEQITLQSPKPEPSKSAASQTIGKEPPSSNGNQCYIWPDSAQEKKSKPPKTINLKFSLSLLPANMFISLVQTIYSWLVT